MDAAEGLRPGKRQPIQLSGFEGQREGYSDAVAGVHVGRLAYGRHGPYKGEGSRGNWRAFCLAQYRRGRGEWNDWQDDMLRLHQESAYLESSFEYQIDAEQRIGNLYCRPRYTMDLTGLQLVSEKNHGFLDFRGFRFRVPVLFNACRFSSKVNFDDCQFEQLVEFRDCVFEQDAFFDGAHFATYAGFQGARFEREASFRQGHWSVAYFNKARFARPPSFGGRNQGCKVFLPDVDIDIRRLDGANFGIWAERLSDLKSHCEETGQIEQALAVNGKELECRARHASGLQGLWQRGYVGAYRVMADYGRSFERPLLLYLFTCLLMFGLAFAHAFPCFPWMPDMFCLQRGLQPATADVDGLTTGRAAFEFMLHRVHGFFAFIDEGKKMQEVNKVLFGQAYEPLPVRLLGGLAAAFAALNLFLFALGLRNRFRMK